MNTWADEPTIPDKIRDKLLIKHVDGPLFFGFASQFRDITVRRQHRVGSWFFGWTVSPTWTRQALMH